MFKVGSALGRYKVIGPLGRGKPDGLFEIEDEKRNRFAMRAPIGDIDVASTKPVTLRFRPDVEALKSISHLNLVPIFDVIVEKGCLCLVMERVRGRTLSEAISHGQFAPPIALDIVRQILAGCAVAHAAGRIHRDLRPGKILLIAMEGWELVKVADFGLGTLRDEAVLEYGAGALTGSIRTAVPTYMAPEQVRERSVDARTDFYAVGTMLFEMLAGRAPFPDRDLEHVKSQQLGLPTPKLADVVAGAGWITNELKELVERSLAKEREERFSSAAQMLVAVDAAYRSIT